LEGETKPMDYLRQEYLDRIKRRPLKYRLYMQLHTPVPGQSQEIYNSAKAWDKVNYPWIEVGVATMTEALSFEEAELLMYRVNHMPPSISIIPAKSLSDYNSLAVARSKVYKYAQGLRLKFYQSRKQIGPTPATPRTDIPSAADSDQSKVASNRR
ncbi:MAG: hypothetical protein COB51_10500, partial [Moraxellaceae bacterium]